MATTEYRRQLREKAKPAYIEFMKVYPFTLEDLDGEEWADVAGYEGLYQVSTFGRVKSLKGRWSKSKILKPLLGGCYLYFALFKNGRYKNWLTHRLVAQKFVQNVNNLPEVDHIDGNKFNCCVSNLRWATSRENKIYASELGLVPTGEKHGMSKLTDEQVAEIRKLYVPNDTEFGARALAKRFGVIDRTIRRIVHGDSYQNANGAIHKPLLKKRVPSDIRKAIRADYQTGNFSKRALAKRYGVCHETIRNIINEK